MAALQRLDHFEMRHEEAFQAYLHRAILNRIRNEIRRTSGRPPTEEVTGEEMGTAPSPLDEVIALEILDRYTIALARLRDEERKAIQLRVDLGMDYEQVAAALGKPTADAARMAVTRALRALTLEMDRV